MRTGGNPFHNRSAITKPDEFYGRKRELRHLADMLSNTQCCAIVGERRMGKSSLLRHISTPEVHDACGLSSSEYIFGYVDFQGKEELSPEDFWRLLLQRFGRHIEDADLKEGFAEVRRQDSIRLLDIEYLLDEIDFTGIKIVCLFDEFEYTAKSKELDANFFSGLRSLANSFPIAYVTATQKSLLELDYLSDALDSPFFNIFREMPLGPFSEDEALQLIHQPVAKTAITFDEDDEAFIFETGGLHPLFLQIACYHLFDTYRESGTINKEESYEGARRNFMDESLQHFRYYWDKSDANEQGILTHLAMLSANQKRVRKSKAEIDIPVLRRLELRGLVKSDAESYEIFSNTFGEWIIEQAGIPKPAEPARIEFQPIPNPYIVGNPIRTKEMFFGRQDDFKYIADNLKNQTSGVLIVLTGERRSGKTSVLYQIQNGELGGSFFPVLIDVQSLVARSENEFYERLASEIRQRFERDGIELKDYDFASEGRHPAGTFGAFIAEAVSAINPKYLLLMFDEYELLETSITDGILSPSFTAFLASLLDKYPRISFIFTGSKHLTERSAEYWRPLLGKSIYHRISFLTKGDTLRLIKEPAGPSVIYEQNVPETIYRLAAGQPFYTQVLCRNLIIHFNTEEKNIVGQEDLDYIVSDLVENPLPQMLYFWEGLSDSEKITLSLLASALSDSESYVNAKEIEDVIESNDYDVTISASDLRKSLESLRSSDALQREGRESYRYRADLFRLWVEHEHSVWQVLSEL